MHTAAGTTSSGREWLLHAPLLRLQPNIVLLLRGPARGSDGHILSVAEGEPPLPQPHSIIILCHTPKIVVEPVIARLLYCCLSHPVAAALLNWLLMQLVLPYWMECPSARWRLAGVVGLTLATTGVR